MDHNRDRMTVFRFDFDDLKNRYDFELQRKEQLTAQLTLPVAVLGLLGSAIVAMARSFSYLEMVLTIPFTPANLRVFADARRHGRVSHRISQIRTGYGRRRGRSPRRV